MRVKLIRLLFMAILAMGTATACFDPVSQDVSISNIRHGKKFTTNLSVASMEYDIQTKSQYSGTEDLVQNWNLFIYDAEDDTRVGAYYRATDNQGTLSPMEFDVKLDHAYRYYAVANVGNVTSSAPAKDFIGGVSQMENFLLTNLGSAGDWNGVGIPSAWSGSQTFSSSTYRTNPAACVLNVQLTRLASRYSFRISHAQLNAWSLNITDFKVYGTTSAKPFSSAGYRETSTSQLPVTDYLLGVEKTFFNNASNDNAYTAAQAINKDFVFSSLNTGRPVCLYALENLCGTGSNTGGGADGWGKVPGNKPSSTNPSYVEITGTATLNDNSGASKSVTFRFYLGENEKNDYNVYRNKLYCITFTPTDESILNGHDGNWKIEPGPFSETRTLAFEHEGVRFRAGTSVVEGINKNPAALKYKVNIPSSLSANGNLVVKNGTTPVTSGSVIDAASLSLEAKDGIDAAGQLEIRTIEGLLYDILNVEIFNAYLQVLPDTPLTWDWNEHTQKDITLTATVPWTATVPSGWSLTYASGGAVSGEQPAGSNVALKILPPTSDYTETTADASVTLSFAATGTDGDAVTLIRRYKPQVLSGGNTLSSMEWEWNEATSTGAKALFISSNEEWVIVWPAGDHSHWTVSPASGAKTVTSISVYPADINDSTSPVSATFYVVPVRGGVNVDAGKLTVNLNHKANLPYINVSGSDLDNGALKWIWHQNGSKSFTVASNIGWMATLDDNATASFNISSGAGTVTVTPKDFNYVTSPVSGNVVLRGTGDFASTTQNVPVSQSRYPSIAVSPDAASWLATAYDARPFTVAITAAEGETYQWAGSVANNPANTVNFSMSPASGNNSTSFTAAPASANGSSTQGNSATVTITLAGDYGSATKPTFSVNLSQASAAPFISISPNVSSLGWHWYEGTSSARKQIEVTTNVADWEIALEGTNASKFYCDYNSTNPNVIDIYPVNINDGAAISGVTLVIRSTDPSQSSLTKNISLSQTKAPSISVNPAQLDWPWDTPSTQTSAVTIDTDESYTWSAALTDGSSYFSLSNATGSSGLSFSVTRSENNNDTEHDLTGTVRVSLVGEMGGQTRYVDVPLRQVKKTAFTLSVAPPYLTFAASDNGEGSKQMITVTSNTSWSVTCPTGYSASMSEGSGDGSFYVWPTSTSSIYTQEAYISNGYVQVNGTGVSMQQVEMRRTSVSPFSHYRFDVEGGGTMGEYSYGSEDFYPVIYAVYEDSHEEYEDYGVNMGNISTSQTDVSGYGSWNSGSYKMTLNSSMPSSYDDLDGSITMTYTGYNYGLNGASATAYFTILGHPYIYVTDPSEWSWNQSGWSAEKNFDISTNRSSVSSTCTSGSGLFYVYASAYTHYARPYDPNNDSSPKTAKYNIYLTYFTDISDELTLTQGGKPQSYTHSAAYIEIYLDEYSIDEGSTTKATAYLYTGEYTDSNPSASNDPDDYTWSSSDITSTVSGQFTSSKSSVASVSGRTVSGNSPGTAVIGTSYVPSGYEKVFDTNPASLTVNAATPVPEFSYWRYYDLEVSLNADPEDPNTIAAAGGTSQLSATATWKRVKVYTDGSEPEPYETGICTSITDSRFSVTRTSGSTEFSYNESYGTVSVGSNTSTSTRSATFTATFTIGSGLGQASDSDDAKVTQEGAVATNTYYAAYTVVSVDDTDLKVNETTSVTATLYVGTYIGPATSAPTSFSSYDWDGGTAISAVSSNINVFGKVSGNTWRGISAGTATVFASVNLGSYDMPFNDLCVTQTVIVSNPDVITYDNFTVTLSSESISKGESSYASATIQKYVNGNKDGNPIDVTDLTAFSKSSSFVTKKGTREFEWNGSGITDVDVTIHGELSHSTYGTHSNNAILTVEKEKWPVVFTFDKANYVVASDAAVTNTCNFSVKVTYSDGSEDYVGTGLIPWSDISINTYSNAFFAGDGEFMAVRANSSTEARLLYKGEPKICTATLTSQNPYELIGINPDISSGEGELYIGFEAEYQYLCQDSAGNMQDNIRVSGIKPTVTPSKISGAGSMTCTWAKLSTSDKFYTITSVSTSKYLFEFYYSDAHGAASIGYYVTKSGGSPSYDVDPADN